MSEPKPNDVYRDADGDEWHVDENGRLHLGSVTPAHDGRTLAYVESSYGPVTKVNEAPVAEYKVGQTYTDRDGDEWTVQGGGRMRCRWLNASRTTDYVEGHYGPLRLTGDASGPVETETLSEPLADWERELLKGQDAEQPGNPDRYEFSVPTELAQRVDDGAGEKFIPAAFTVYTDALNLLFRKQADYGPRNIARSPGGPINGLVVRMWDKMARLVNLTNSGQEPENEPLRDTFVDLLNYSAIALLVMDGEWPGVE